MCKKIPLPVGGHNLCMSLIEKSQGSASGASVDRLPQSVEYKHWLIEQGIHDLVFSKMRAWNSLVRAVNASSATFL